MAAKKKKSEPKFDAFGPAKAVVNNARAVANMITNSSGPSMKAGKNPPARKGPSSMYAAAPKPYVAPFKKAEAPRPAPKKKYVAPYNSETPRGPRSGGKPLNTTPVPKPKKNKPKGGGKNVPVWKF
jgi:hypothetical protein